LDRLDVTIHSPATSKAEVLESLILIRGERDALPVEGSPAITARAAQERYRYLHGEMPLLAIYVAAKLRRGKLWSALQGLQTMRNAVMEIYGLTRGSTLPSRFFIKHAPKDLQDSLGATLAIYDLAPIAESLRRLVALYREECGRLSNGHLSFSEGEAKAFDRIELLLAE